MKPGEEAALPWLSTPLPRRRFLWLATGAIGLALWPFGCGGVNGALPAKVTHLSDAEAWTILGAYRAAVPEQDRKKFQGGEKVFLQEADSLFAMHPPHLQSDIRLALGAVRRAPLLTWSLRPLESAAGAALALERMLNLRVLGPRMAAQSALQMVFFVYYGNPGAWPGMGYDGPWVKP